MKKQNLASERKRKGLNQTQLADVLGISLTTLNKYELGAREIPSDVLLQAADYFECSTDYLLGRTDERLLH